MMAKYVDTLDAELEQRIQLKDGEMRRQKPKLSGKYELGKRNGDLSCQPINLELRQEESQIACERKQSHNCRKYDASKGSFSYYVYSTKET
jgi:hypothetical protein